MLQLKVVFLRGLSRTFFAVLESTSGTSVCSYRLPLEPAVLPNIGVTWAALVDLHFDLFGLGLFGLRQSYFADPVFERCFNLNFGVVAQTTCHATHRFGTPL